MDIQSEKEKKAEDFKRLLIVLFRPKVGDISQ